MYGRSAQAEELCTRALGIDPFDEKLIEYHIRALISQDKNAQALVVYKKMESMFFDVLGVNFSENLRALHNKILQPEIKKESTLDELLEQWLEEADDPGAYYCDAGIFKTLYQIETRSAPRSGRMAFVVRIDTKHEPGAKSADVMKPLGVAIASCLRMGDIYTRYSPGQYLILLYSLTYEDCKMLIGRILHTIDSKHLKKIIGTHIKHVVPVD